MEHGSGGGPRGRGRVHIFLGLPVARVEMRNVRLKTLLNGISAGILAFLLVDILANAGEVLEGSLTSAQSGGSWDRFAGC